MAVMTYKCPNCGGGLTFDPKTQKLTCEYCMSEFAEEDVAGGQEPETVSVEAEKSELSEEAVIYTCPSCGAEIVTEETTAATFCYYCHNPVVLSGRVSGEFLPDHILPFAIDRRRAEEMFLTWISKKKFVPHSFYNKNQLEKLSGVYFPYWMYSCQVDGKVQAEAEKQKTWTTGNTRFTEHQQYKIQREGTLEVKNLARNALSKTNKELVEGVLPFETEEMLPFHTNYLSGFMAEKRDMDSEGFAKEAEQEVREYTIQNLTSTMSEYSSVRVQNSDTKIRDAKWQYAMLPVWVMTYRHKEQDKVYYFTMNGQNGKICGKLPVDKKKLMGLFAKIFAPVFAALMIGGWFL